MIENTYTLRESLYIFFTASFFGIQEFYFKNRIMHNVQMHTGATRKLLYGLLFSTGDNPLAKARGLSSRTHAHPIQ